MIPLLLYNLKMVNSGHTLEVASLYYSNFDKSSINEKGCFLAYKALQKSTVPTTADIVVPYIADGIAAVAAYANDYSLMGIVSSVVTADWISKFTLGLAKEIAFLWIIEEYFIENSF